MRTGCGEPREPVGTSAGVSQRAGGLRRSPVGYPVRSCRTGRVRLQSHGQQAAGDRLYAAWVLCGAQVSRAVSTAWHWWQRKPLDAVRRGGRDSRQSDCRQQGRPHDHRDAQRPCVERTVDDVLAAGEAPVPVVRVRRWARLLRAPRKERELAGRPAPRLERMGADAAVPAAREWPSSSPPTRRSSGNWSAT